MKTHNLIQGSQEWLAYRAQHFNASDAPAMMGCSPYKARAALLREMHTGVTADVDIATQKRFDNGHRAEALARPLAEEFIGEELYPVTGSEGRLSASFDGLTLEESKGFEHKALNADLKAVFAEMLSGGWNTDAEPGRLLPIYHRVQMEQQLLVSGAERILFMSSSWTAEEDLIEEQHCWYYPDFALRQQIIDGWAQFERDLATYTLPESAPAAPVGKAPEQLPALRIEVTGMVTASNLAEFKQTALGAIRSVNRNLATDQDFANAEKAVKWCGDVESRLKAAKEHALSQTTSIEALFRTIDEISGEARTVRLDLDKLVARRKSEVKEEAVLMARRALDHHIGALNAEIAPMRVPAPVVDFAGVIRGLKSVASMADKLDGLVTAAKIAADADARAIRANLTAFQQAATGFEFLFADLGQLVHKAADDFSAVLQARIAAHKAELERKRVDAEKAEHLRMLMSELQGINQQVAIAQIGRSGVRKGGTIECIRDTLAETEAWRLDQAHWGEHFQRAQEAKDGAITAIRTLLLQAERAEQAAQQPAAAAVATTVAPPAPQAAPAPAYQAPAASPAPAPARHVDERANLSLGVICTRLGFNVSGAFLAEKLGIKPMMIQKNASYFTESQFALLCERLRSHVGAMAELYAGEPA